MPAPAVKLANVRKTYRSGDEEVVALDHATLEVAAGELVALVGPSGSGKTTLLSIAGALLAATEGEVEVGGTDLTGLSEKQRTAFRGSEIGFVFQAVNLVPFLTARENLLVVAEMNGRLDKDAKQRADQLLEELGLSHRTRNQPGELSGGERQRVAIGRALMNEPSLVLFDEPTSALDTKLGEQVMELIRREVIDRGVGGIFVTHDTRMTHHADRTIEIVDGVLRS
ncbi:MAG TPA: ABC transporter ATP-binding protein [Acidimicrobiales bacterium]|nr:ABC transporter ATP-binding protein [Acidimicrobiales bacterium]